MANLKALPSFIRAARLDRTLREHERYDRARVEAHQRHALTRIVAHAIARSPFYRELYAAHGVDAGSPLQALPPVDKPELMKRFDEWVTDPRITLASAQAHLAAESETLLNESFVVLASGGSSRQPGVYVFGREEWDMVCALLLRASRWHGMTPRIPRLRMASVVAPGSRHMAGRSSRTFDLGIHRTIHLSATQPHDELIAALNHFQPDFLTGYASVIALLAADQADGRLTITPSIVSTSSEPRSAPMTDRIRDAWGIEPFDVYATTETGVLALDCAAHSGQHVFEDIAIVEVVDEDDGPVPDGQPGHHLLVTNLYNRTQPFIRYRLSDMTGFQPGSCSCGLPFRRLQTIAGRQDDILELPGANGSAVQLHPTALAPLFALDGVAELEIVQRGHQLHTTIVPRPTAQPDAVTALLNERIQATLAGCGCAAVPVHIHLASQLTRHPIAGKIKLVRREDGP